MLRIKELDYLRGLSSLGIMLYHYMKWLYVYEGANSFIGRISVYGVEIFYILSGITLFHVYQHTLTLKSKPLTTYFLKRFFRIFPLFWLSIILTIIVFRKFFPISQLLLNVSGLFSILTYDKYIAAGTWSVGNELVFYLLFPFLIYLYKLNRVYYAFVGLIFLLLFHYFAFYIFNPFDTLHNQWGAYVNPLNHIWLFFVGMTIPIILKKDNTFNYKSFLLLLIGVIMLFVYPSGNDGIHLLYGANRWIFSIGSILICAGFYQSEMKLPKLIHEPLKQLGEMSYSVYLLHSFVYQLVCMAIRKAQSLGYAFPESNVLLIIVSVLCTLVISKLIYHYFEVYFIRKGAALIPNFYKS